MDRHCSRQSPYQPSAGQVYLDYLRLEGRAACTDERFRALELSVRPLSAAELEEHHKRETCLKQDANYRWAKVEKVRALEARAFTALPQCRAAPAKANSGTDNFRRQLSKRVLQYPQPKHRPPPLDLAQSHYRQQQRLGTSYEQRGYLEYETADQNRRVARMGLGRQKSHEQLAVPQTALPIPVTELTNHPFPQNYAPKENLAQQTQEQSKAQRQQPKTPTCGQWARERTNDLLLKTRCRQEAEQRKVAQEKCKHQNREQQKFQLPAAKPGNLYPGPTRIAGVAPTIRTVHNNNMNQSKTSEPELSVQLESRMASQEEYRKHQEENERRKEDEGYEAASSVPRLGTSRTEFVKQLLASVNKAMDHKYVAAEIEAIHTDGEKHKEVRAQSQQSLENAPKAGLEGEERFWYKSDKNEAPPGQSYGHPKGVDDSSRYTGSFQRKVPFDPSQSTDLHAAVDAIDRVSGELLESPDTAFGQDEPELLEPSTVPVSRDRENSAADAADSPLVSSGNPSAKLPRQDVSSLPIPQSERTKMSSNLREGEETSEDIKEATPLDIQLEWEEVDDSLGDDGWCEVKHDLVKIVESVSSSSSDVEWTSDVASEGAIDF